MTKHSMIALSVTSKRIATLEADLKNCRAWDAAWIQNEIQDIRNERIRLISAHRHAISLTRAMMEAGLFDMASWNLTLAGRIRRGF